jgi:hypothetical protein
MTVEARNPEKQIARLYVQGVWIVCKTPYNPDFVTELKFHIDRGSRKWDSVEKVWKVDVDQMDLLETICKKHYKEVLFIEVEQTIVAGGTAAGSASPYHNLISDLPDDALKRVFRLCALSMHPDQGGTNEGINKVMDAWHIIEKERGLK